MLIRTCSVRALAFAESAIRIDPDSAEAYCLKADILQTQLRLPEAVDAYKAALDRRKGYERAYDGWRVSKRVMGQNQSRGLPIAKDLVAIAAIQELAQKQGRLAESSVLFGALAKDPGQKLAFWKSSISAAGIDAAVSIGDDGLAGGRIHHAFSVIQLSPYSNFGVFFM